MPKRRPAPRPRYRRRARRGGSAASAGHTRRARRPSPCLAPRRHREALRPLKSARPAPCREPGRRSRRRPKSQTICRQRAVRASGPPRRSRDEFWSAAPPVPAPRSATARHAPAPPPLQARMPPWPGSGPALPSPRPRCPCPRWPGPRYQRRPLGPRQGAAGGFRQPGSNLKSVCWPSFAVSQRAGQEPGPPPGLA